MANKQSIRWRHQIDDWFDLLFSFVLSVGRVKEKKIILISHRSCFWWHEALYCSLIGHSETKSLLWFGLRLSQFITLPLCLKSVKESSKEPHVIKSKIGEIFLPFSRPTYNRIFELLCCFIHAQSCGIWPLRQANLPHFVSPTVKLFGQ